MRARPVSSSLRSLVAYVALTACAARPPPAPVALPAPPVTPVVVAPAPPVPPDAVELVGTSLHSWVLVNHTPVTIEHPGSMSFTLAFERLGFEDHWLPRRHVSYCVTGYVGDFAPMVPGASRPVSHPYFISRNTFPAGTWRAVVDYRDPRHPAFPSRAEAVFDVVGLTPAQAEGVLAAVADPAHRACVRFPNVAHGFAQTAPLAMLPRLLELPEETVAEREEALVAITAATHDGTLLRRALQEENPPVRLSAARAVVRTGTRDDLLWSLATPVILFHVTADAPIEVADVHALFRLIPQWTPAVLERVLQRVADRRASEVSVALARGFGAYVDRFPRADLVRIRQVLVRTVAQERDAELRALYLRPIRDCTVALNPAPGPFRTLPESGPDDAEVDSFNVFGCEPVHTALQTMMELAANPERMQFIPRSGERRASASPAR